VVHSSQLKTKGAAEKKISGITAAVPNISALEFFIAIVSFPPDALFYKRFKQQE
jgi:hypothetical protein